MNRALEGFSCLDDVLGKISKGEAASRLASIAKETIHQVETPDADIQVLGLLEATGLWFDRMRVIGCHEYALPSEPSTNPFLPPGLQAQKRVPHSTGEMRARVREDRHQKAPFVSPVSHGELAAFL